MRLPPVKKYIAPSGPIIPSVKGKGDPEINSSAVAV
jgi:hypothetical protein